MLGVVICVLMNQLRRGPTLSSGGSVYELWASKIPIKHLEARNLRSYELSFPSTWYGSLFAGNDPAMRRCAHYIWMNSHSKLACDIDRYSMKYPDSIQYRPNISHWLYSNQYPIRISWNTARFQSIPLDSGALDVTGMMMIDWARTGGMKYPIQFHEVPHDSNPHEIQWKIQFKIQCKQLQVPWIPSRIIESHEESY